MKPLPWTRKISSNLLLIHAVMGHRVEIYDTTLRDGTQAENFTLSVADRVRISLQLDKLGIDYIEGGLDRIQAPWNILKPCRVMP
jgi:hypothetical protein